MPTMRALLGELTPSSRDEDYYIRFVTGCLFATAFFAVSAAFSFKEFSDYSDYQGREGNTFFYGDRDAITGSAGQAYVALVLAAAALVAALVVVAMKWRMGAIAGVRAFGTILIFCAIAGGFTGLLGSGLVQLGLGEIASRSLFWVLLPLLAIGAVIGVLLYAKEGEGTVLDL